MDAEINVGISVGLLNVLLNVGVLLLVASADYVITQTCKHFAIARLAGPERRAPIVHDSDHSIPNIPFSAYKFRRHPGILFMVFASILLICSEITTELGVGISPTCRTKTVDTMRAICAGDATDESSAIGNIGSAFLLQSIALLEVNLTRAPALVRKDISGNECFSCMPETEYPDVASECEVRALPPFPAGKMAVSAFTTKAEFGTITTGFREVDTGKRHTGPGDLVFNGDSALMFVVSHERLESEASIGIVFFEYEDLDMAQKLLSKAQAASVDEKEVEEITDKPVRVYHVSCGVNRLSTKNFRKALQVYRSTTFEGLATRPLRKDNRFAALTKQDVYKAVLALKMADTKSCKSKTIVYSGCGTYQVKYLVPLVVCVILILTFRILSGVSSGNATRGKRNSYQKLFLPHNSASWFETNVKNESLQLPRVSNAKRSSRGLHDQLVLYDREDGSVEVRIETIAGASQKSDAILMSTTTDAGREVPSTSESELGDNFEFYSTLSKGEATSEKSL